MAAILGNVERMALEPWFQSIADPHQAQEHTLLRLIEGYQKTQYAQELGAGKVSSIEEFQRAFPVVTYTNLKPHAVLERRFI